MRVRPALPSLTGPTPSLWELLNHGPEPCPPAAARHLVHLRSWFAESERGGEYSPPRGAVPPAEAAFHP